MLKNGMRKLSIIFFAAFLMCAAFFLASQAVTYADTADSAFESEMTAQGFPESYKPYLRMLHFQHPTWHFKAKNLGFTWNEALTKQYAGSNTVATSYPDAFKAVKSGTYNFSTHTYYAKDGASWVAASKQAVAFYMDPRNWLTEDSVFMDEQKMHPPVLLVPSRLGQVKPPSMDSLTVFWPNCFFSHVLIVLYLSSIF